MSVLDDLKAAYPARYYASMDKPCAWYDMWSCISTDGLPAASTLFAMTADQWAAKGGNTGTKSMAVENGALVDYTPPVVPVPLKTQAATAQAWIQQQANLAGAMGEVFTADMKAYVKAIAAIANGTDTTSTALPTQPTDVMTTTSSTSAT
ncbi:hypothetical protein [Acetobacter ghanensis]|uniref:Uncharacterized protein n=1 Tax=Acetobacter ghanensis TaxID=431306 RepID=A0A0U5BHA5_9PROT|nr:hypothetical protein [Acetobacter ghanensis]NHO39495.1 hypothetical protein [Acetobacter ghanensis]GBQ46313.1 hypothetical protein AA18895_0728 [Acetobacter ghanensis DSM 18895]CEF54653.1 hypothetical protein predicted by Glimmer/Critica [Acetobacter ghanensis]